NELREIVGVGCNAVVLSLIRPRFDSEISLGIGDEPIPLGDLLSHPFPGTKVMRRSVDEDDRFAGALIDVLQANPVDLDLLGHGLLLSCLLPPSASGTCCLSC